MVELHAPYGDRRKRCLNHRCRLSGLLGVPGNAVRMLMSGASGVPLSGLVAPVMPVMGATRAAGQQTAGGRNGVAQHW